MAAPPNFEKVNLHTDHPSSMDNTMGGGTQIQWSLCSNQGTRGTSIFNGKNQQRVHTEADKKAVEKNFRAKKILVYGLESKEYDRVSTCDTAKEIWETLQIAYQGTTQVKQDKSNTDDSSTMAVEGEEIGYDSTLALMSQSDNDEDNGNEQVTFRDVQKI